MEIKRTPKDRGFGYKKAYEYEESIKYYQCMFTAVGGAYSMNMYDLPTDDEVEIKEILEDQGYEVLEIYSIKPQ